MSYEEVFKMEFRISQTFMNKKQEFFEGVRATLVDKDKKPKWNPSTLAEVSSKEVDEFFQKLDEDQELKLE